MSIALHELGRTPLLERLAQHLLPAPDNVPDHATVYAGLLNAVSAQDRDTMPALTRSAAVLIGLVDRAEGLQVLLTQRAAELSNHAGQISFPGGRIEPEDSDAWAAACRETQEEVGVAPELLQRLGYLPDHSVISGFRVTPVVALVQPNYELRLDQREVAEAFEVPLRHFLDPRHHQVRERRNGNRHFQVSAMPYEGREIWGATAGILLTMFNLLDRGVSR